MLDIKAVDGLEVLASTKHIDNIYGALVEGKATNATHRRREKTSKRPL